MASPTGAVNLHLLCARAYRRGSPCSFFIWRNGVAMRVRFTAGATLALALLAGGAIAAGALKSGPQPGDHVDVFEPLCLSGKSAGQKFCPV